MVKLKHHQWNDIRCWFSPTPGYVLDFSNRTFEEFFQNHFGVNMYSDAFSAYGTSKFNRLKAFIEVSPPHTVIELLTLLWRRGNAERDEEIDRATRLMGYDDFAATPEYVAALQDAAAEEDRPFLELISKVEEGATPGAASQLKALTTQWSLDTLNREIEHAIQNVDMDPEASITAACSMLDSVCRSIIVCRGVEFPKRLDIQTLYKSAREPLGLSPDKEGLVDVIANDVRTILAALGALSQGIGSLRSHAGSAHGRERGFRRVDARIARLAVNSAFAVSVFLVETWEKRYPEDKLAAT